jgi:hypothetical protein
MKRHLLALAAALGANFVAAQPAMDHGSHAQRQAEVSGRGGQVMPFELSATQHVFTKTRTGGVEKVVARRAGDRQQVRLVREHLKEIRGQFSRGDFSGPSHIHGADMPGLKELQAARPGAVRITYHQLPAGAELVFASADHRLVFAIHQWFDAQVADHGHDAMAGHDHEHDHEHR